MSAYEAVFGPIVAAIETEMLTARQEQGEIAPILWNVIDYVFGWDLPPDTVEQRAKVTGKKIRPPCVANTGTSCQPGPPWSLSITLRSSMTT
jgi:hypothetical protein